MPASRAAPYSAAEVSASASPPNDMHPNASRETFTPVRPRNRSSIGVTSRSLYERAFDAREHLLFARRDLADAEEATGRARDQAGEVEDLLLQEPRLLVVELRRERLDVELPRQEEAVVRLLREPALEQGVARRALFE